MLTYQRFTGINNVVPAERLVHDPKTGSAPLVEGMNVDIGLTGEISRRAGYSQITSVCHKNLHQAAGFQLATVDSDLKAIAPNGAETMIYPSLGVSRVWYGDLPDGRTTFSNGLICGITDGAGMTTWGPPLPASVGAAADVSGDLFPGTYRYSLTYVRTSDGLEGGTTYADPLTLSSGGLVLTGLPTLAGHSINVYLTSGNGDINYLAGNTTGSTFSFTSANDTLVQPCRTDLLNPATPGTVTAFWRGRTLIADGKCLRASLANRWELFDQKDVKQFADNITMIQPVLGGIFVGTEGELAFLEGDNFDELIARHNLAGPVVLGSGVTVPGQYLKRADATAGQGDCMMCICGGLLTAGYPDGFIGALSQGVYSTAAAEVAATFRLVNGIPQYVAIPQ